MNILVAYDGTKEAKEAARLACKHAKAFNGQIILAYSMVGGPEIPRKEFETAEKGTPEPGDHPEGGGVCLRNPALGAGIGDRRGHHQDRRGKEGR